MSCSRSGVVLNDAYPSTSLCVLDSVRFASPLNALFPDDSLAASGSGTTVEEVRQLLKHYKQSKKLVKMMKGGGNRKMKQLMKQFGGQMPDPSMLEGVNT